MILFTSPQAPLHRSRGMTAWNKGGGYGHQKLQMLCQTHNRGKGKQVIKQIVRIGVSITNSYRRQRDYFFLVKYSVQVTPPAV